MMTNSISRGELWLETLAPNAKRLEVMPVRAGRRRRAER